jgi:hypothetical protein
MGVMNRDYMQRTGDEPPFSADDEFAPRVIKVEYQGRIIDIFPPAGFAVRIGDTLDMSKLGTALKLVNTRTQAWCVIIFPDNPADLPPDVAAPADQPPSAAS